MLTKRSHAYKKGASHFFLGSPKLYIYTTGEKYWCAGGSNETGRQSIGSTKMESPSHPLPPYIVVFGPGANCTLDLCPVQYSLYRYRPSLAANGTFIALFAVACIVHILQGIRYRTYFFTGAVIVGCTSAILGYIGRIMLYYNPFQFSAFMLQMSEFKVPCALGAGR